MKLKLNISDCRIVQHLTPTISSVENLYGRNWYRINQLEKIYGGLKAEHRD